MIIGFEILFKVHFYLNIVFLVVHSKTGNVGCPLKYVTVSAYILIKTGIFFYGHPVELLKQEMELSGLSS